MSHTEEPWLYSKSKHGIDGGHDVIAVINNGNDDMSLLIHAEGEDFNGVDNARRIVACVNACAGASTEYLEGFAVGVNATGIPTDKVMELPNNERDTYRDLCAELLKAANDYLPYMPISTAKEGGANRHSGMLKASDNLKEAITKAESILGEKNGR